MAERGHEGLSKKNYRTYSKLYRDPAAFEVVEDEVLWELGKDALRRGVGQTVEAWSCGCSAGEEVFSLLMSWEQVLAEHFPSVNLSYLGTDISHDAIDAANRAEYGEHAVQDVPAAWIERCFDTGHDEQDRQTYTVQERLKRHATFVQQDVREAMPSKAFDLITCRYSVFLYCSKDECAKFLKELVELGCLRAGGFLFIGQPDELPSAWRSLGLQEWRGHQGLYRLAQAVNPIALQPSNIRAAHDSLSDFLGPSVRRPAAERIGRPEEVAEAQKLTPEQMALNLARFDKWHQIREERVAQLRAEALEKEKAEVAATVFISQKKMEAFAQRMQDEAARREKKLKQCQERAHATDKKMKKKMRKVAVGRRKTGSQSEQAEAAAQRAAQASALWIARTRAKADRTAGTWGAPPVVYSSVPLRQSREKHSWSAPRSREQRSGTGSSVNPSETSGALSARETRLFTEAELRRRRKLDALRSGAPSAPHSERERRSMEFRMRLEVQERKRIREIEAAHSSGNEPNTPTISDHGAYTTSGSSDDEADTCTTTDDDAQLTSDEDLLLPQQVHLQQQDLDVAYETTGTGPFLKVMVASPCESKLSKQQQLDALKTAARKVERKVHVQGDDTTDNAAAPSACAADTNAIVAAAGTPRLVADSTHGTLEQLSEPYLRAIVGAGAGKEDLTPRAPAASRATRTTPVPPNGVRSCPSSGLQPPAAVESALLQDCTTVQASNVPCHPEPQRLSARRDDTESCMGRQAQNAMPDVASSSIGFRTGSLHAPAMQVNQQPQKQRSRPCLQRQPSRPSDGAQHCGRAVASAFSAAKRYSDDARQRCSKVAGLHDTTRLGAKYQIGASAGPSAVVLPSAAMLSCRLSFEQKWVTQAAAAQPRLVTAADGRRSWVRGW